MTKVISNRLKYQKDIYAMYLVGFISSLGLVGPFMIKFFEDWGGLDQFWIFVLQAFFTGWILILEIPTGIVADLWGRKLSYCIGILLLSIGPIVYTWEPQIEYFFAGEFIFAVGLSFISGSEDALIRDILQRNDQEDDMSEVSTRFRNFHYLGMIVASLVTIILKLESLPLDWLFLSGAPVMLVSLLIVIFFVRDERGGKERNGNSIFYEYHETFRTGKDVFRNNRRLWSFAIFVNGIALVGYFVIWYYQKYMELVGIEIEHFAAFRIVFLVGQISVSTLLVSMRKSKFMAHPYRQAFLAKLIVAAISFGAFVAFIVALLSFFEVEAFAYQHIVGAIALLVIVGGLSINLRSVYSREVNDCIPDDERATVLSFISMGRNASRTLTNPLFGAGVRINPSFGLIGMMGIARITELFALPREVDFVQLEREKKKEN